MRRTYTTSDCIEDIEAQLEWIDGWHQQVEKAVLTICCAPGFEDDGSDEQLAQLESLMEGLNDLRSRYAEDIDALLEPDDQYDNDWDDDRYDYN